MNSQGESDVLQSTLLPVPHQPDPSLPDPIPEDALSSAFLRFQAIEIMRDMPLIEGSTWVLVSKAWWRRFEKAATGQVDKEGGVDEEGLGPVDNSSLLDTDGCLNENLVEGVDFDCVPDVVWEWLIYMCVRVSYQTFVLLTPSIQIWHVRTKSHQKKSHHSRHAKRTIHRAASAALPLLRPDRRTSKSHGSRWQAVLFHYILRFHNKYSPP